MTTIKSAMSNVVGFNRAYDFCVEKNFELVSIEENEYLKQIPYFKFSRLPKSSRWYWRVKFNFGRQRENSGFVLLNYEGEKHLCPGGIDGALLPGFVFSGVPVAYHYGWKNKEYSDGYDLALLMEASFFFGKEVIIRMMNDKNNAYGGRIPESCLCTWEYRLMAKAYRDLRGEEIIEEQRKQYEATSTPPLAPAPSAEKPDLSALKNLWNKR